MHLNVVFVDKPNHDHIHAFFKAKLTAHFPPGEVYRSYCASDYATDPAVCALHKYEVKLEFERPG